MSMITRIQSWYAAMLLSLIPRRYRWMNLSRDDVDGLISANETNKAIAEWAMHKVRLSRRSRNRRLTNDSKEDFAKALNHLLWEQEQDLDTAVETNRILLDDCENIIWLIQNYLEEKEESKSSRSSRETDWEKVLMAADIVQGNALHARQAMRVVVKGNDELAELIKEILV